LSVPTRIKTQTAKF
jgi:hypothetical protein